LLLFFTLGTSTQLAYAASQRFAIQFAVNVAFVLVLKMRSALLPETIFADFDDFPSLSLNNYLSAILQSVCRFEFFNIKKITA